LGWAWSQRFIMKRPQQCGAELLNLVVMKMARSRGGYIYLKDMPLVWYGTFSVSTVDFHVASVAQTKSLDKLRQIFETNNDCCFWMIFHRNILFCLLPYMGSWITHLGCGHTQSEHTKHYQLHLAHRIAINASQNDPIHAATKKNLSSRFAGMDVFRADI